MFYDEWEFGLVSTFCLPQETIIVGKGNSRTRSINRYNSKKKVYL